MLFNFGLWITFWWADLSKEQNTKRRQASKVMQYFYNEEDEDDF